MTAQRIAAILRGSFRLSRLTLHLAWGVVLVAFAFPPMRGATRDRVIMNWSQRLLGVLGVEVRIGAAPEVASGALLVSNHVSWLDIYLIHAARRVHFVSKAEVRAWPVAGWLAHKTGTLFLERGRRADTARINAEMHALMESGAWVAVFPEGTTSDGRGVRRFLPSLLQPAVELGRPVVPAALRYRSRDGRLSDAAAYIDEMSLWTSLWRIARQHGLVAELHFGEPIPSDRHRRELAAESERAVAGLLGLSPLDPASAGTESRTRADLPA
ncbi:MAG TPA: 1-acyl-sn-glycerol-3-phosphate acyltransferase [Thiobacillaceae bacterium]|nr:1-acyl-sn-glycerol-3-phosphate acyltransferase [Thiobacillaceae bacterium]